VCGSGTTHGGQTGLEYYTGYLVEKSLSVDNLFVFLLLLTAFAVPRELQQRVLLIGIIGALILRGIFIALGAQLIASFSWAFLLFGAVLLVTAVKVLRDAIAHDRHRPSTSARYAASAHPSVHARHRHLRGPSPAHAPAGRPPRAHPAGPGHRRHPRHRHRLRH
jgi:predicted tellurium resistance membrane protein TerC